MKALKITGIVLLSLILIYILIAAIAPKTYNVKRTLVINAPADVIFSQVNSYKSWEPWSPWLKHDSTIKNTYSGTNEGVGNKVSWTSEHSGKGSMEIKESQPGKYIQSELQMENFQPFQSHFSFTPVDGGTEVVWADSGSTPFLLKPFNFFADQLMGNDLDEGLRSLKSRVESLPKWKLSEYKIEETAPMTILSVTDSCKVDDIGKKLGALYGEIGPVMKKNKLGFIGPVMAYYYTFTPENVVLEAAVPVEKEVKTEGRVKCRKTEKTKALTVTFFGDYELMSEAMPRVMDYMKANKLEMNGPECDIYVNDPSTVKDKIEIETKMVFPVK